MKIRAITVGDGNLVLRVFEHGRLLAESHPIYDPDSIGFVVQFLEEVSKNSKLRAFVFERAEGEEC